MLLDGDFAGGLQHIGRGLTSGFLTSMAFGDASRVDVDQPWSAAVDRVDALDHRGMR